jgi:hypothetical protein
MSAAARSPPHSPGEITYGCGVSRSVCPWNVRFGRELPHASRLAHGEEREPGASAGAEAPARVHVARGHQSAEHRPLGGPARALGEPPMAHPAWRQAAGQKARHPRRHYTSGAIASARTAPGSVVQDPPQGALPRAAPRVGIAEARGLPVRPSAASA